jgi:hypothetical protein
VNRLAGETSPYLLQHAANPVDWYPWGPEALSRARREGKPIFLSIGYAACHWCHVMERESFENETIAAFLNERFVSIKVDREERPDLDEIYMTAVQAMTGQGGWPLTAFLTPDLEPFFGGTYFPPEDRWGRAGLLTVLRRIDEAWRERREEVARSAAELAFHLRALGEVPTPSGRPAGVSEILRAAASLAGRFDARWGGFGGAPKFPPHGALALLLREAARTGEPAPLRMVETTLDRMALGGMYDQIGGGFSRYSVDERWLVPHFEKMLYDQALLVPVYVDAWLLTRRPLYRRVAEETLDFVRRELTDPGGGFRSSLDADSEGHEGKFYVWTPAEVREVLGPEDGERLCALYGIDENGNFEGKCIPNLLGGEDEERVRALAPLRARLLAARGDRVRPATDDKILTSWNGLMIGAFARARQAFGRDEDLDAARRAARFALAELRSSDGRLRASWRRGEARLNAYLDDYVFLARGLLDLHESEFDREILRVSAALMRTALARFGDGAGGFHFTADDHESLLARTRSVHDGALPAGSGVAAETLARLAVHTGDDAFATAAEAALVALRPEVERAPAAFAALLAAADFLAGPTPEIVVAGSRDLPATSALLDAARRTYLPSRAIAWTDGRGGEDDSPLLRGKRAPEGGALAFVCRGSACEAPVASPSALEARLAALRRRS